eukprot:scaffold12291_cov36-Phaeocystis_antarctica.AAC.2
MYWYTSSRGPWHVEHGSASRRGAVDHFKPSLPRGCGRGECEWVSSASMEAHRWSRQWRAAGQGKRAGRAAGRIGGRAVAAVRRP